MPTKDAMTETLFQRMDVLQLAQSKVVMPVQELLQNAHSRAQILIVLVALAIIRRLSKEFVQPVPQLTFLTTMHARNAAIRLLTLEKLVMTAI